MYSTHNLNPFCVRVSLSFLVRFFWPEAAEAINKGEAGTKVGGQEIKSEHSNRFVLLSRNILVSVGASQKKR